jgi:hypothetical protein
VRQLVGLAAIALALALGACGGDDDGDPSSQNAATAPSESADSPGLTTDDPSSTDDEHAQTKPIKRDEYRRRADRICRRAQLAIARRSREYRALGRALARRKLKRQEYFRRAGRLTEESGEIAQRAVADLKELPPPTSRREAVAAYLRGATKQSDILTAQGRALRQGRLKEVRELNRDIAEAGEETRRAARRVGFRICGGGGG